MDKPCIFRGNPFSNLKQLLETETVINFFKSEPAWSKWSTRHISPYILKSENIPSFFSLLLSIMTLFKAIATQESGRDSNYIFNFKSSKLNYSTKPLAFRKSKCLLSWFGCYCFTSLPTNSNIQHTNKCCYKIRPKSL